MAQMKALWRPTLHVVALLAALGVACAQTSSFWTWSPGEEPRLLSSDAGDSMSSVVAKHFPGVQTHMYLVPAELRAGDGLSAVVFRWLTNDPLFVVTAFPDRIPAYVESFDYQAYLMSWELRSQLEQGLRSTPPVTDLTILLALGAPSSRVTLTTRGTQTERWEYAHLRIVLFFSRGSLTSVMQY